MVIYPPPHILKICLFYFQYLFWIHICLSVFWKKLLMLCVHASFSAILIRWVIDHREIWWDYILHQKYYKFMLFVCFIGREMPHRSVPTTLVNMQLHFQVRKNMPVVCLLKTMRNRYILVHFVKCLLFIVWRYIYTMWMLVLVSVQDVVIKFSLLIYFDWLADILLLYV